MPSPAFTYCFRGHYAIVRGIVPDLLLQRKQLDSIPQLMGGIFRILQLRIFGLQQFELPYYLPTKFIDMSLQKQIPLDLVATTIQ